MCYGLLSIKIITVRVNNMSMGTSFYADHANAMKDEWIKKLEEASKVEGFYYSEAVDRIKTIIEEMKEFYFTE